MKGLSLVECSVPYARSWSDLLNMQTVDRVAD